MYGPRSKQDYQADLVVHKRRPLAIKSADGGSISGEGIPGAWHNEEGRGRSGGEGTDVGKGKERYQRRDKRPKRVSSGVGVGKRRGFQYSVVIKLLSGLFEDHLSL